MKITTEILIVDDHPAVCEGIATMLNSARKNAFAFRFAHNGENALALLKEKPVSLVILDVNMGAVDGREILIQIKKMKPKPCVLIMSFQTTYGAIQRMMKAGANGYVSKLISAEELSSGVSIVLKGENYFGNEVSRVLLEHSLQPKTIKANIPLSARELEILKMICQDYPHDYIANALSISPRTVEGHAKNLRVKLKARSTVGMVMYAYQAGIVE